MRARSLVSLAGLVAFGLGPAAAPLVGQEPVPAADEADFERFVEDRARLVRELANDLVELAAWCEREELFAARAALLEDALFLEPDHAAARAALGWSRGEGGAWVRVETPPQPADEGDEEATLELAQRRAALVSAWRRRFLHLVERHEAALAPSRRADELALLLRFDPGDAEVRARLGEARASNGAWVLQETLDARERRTELAELARELLASAPRPQPAESEPFEEELGVAWTARLKTDRVRLLASSGEDEARAAVRAAHAIGDLYREALGSQSPLRRGFTAYLLGDAEERHALLAAWPDLSDADRAWYATLHGAWFGDSPRLALWGDMTEDRLDLLCRQVVASLLSYGSAVGTNSGWLWEGVGLYLVHALVGTRLTHYVQRGRYDAPSERALELELLERPDWLVAARELYASERPPRLAFVIGKDVNQMDVRDAVVAHALAAYLIEARPDALRRAIGLIGAKRSSTEALEKALAMDLPLVERRLVRWLNEL